MVFVSLCRRCFFNDTATTEIYTLSLHDALPICPTRCLTAPVSDRTLSVVRLTAPPPFDRVVGLGVLDRKSTRLNSSHANISYAVFCLKKKQQISFLHTPASEPYLSQTATAYGCQ